MAAGVWLGVKDEYVDLDGEGDTAANGDVVTVVEALWVGAFDGDSDIVIEMDAVADIVGEPVDDSDKEGETECVPVADIVGDADADSDRLPSNRRKRTLVGISTSRSVWTVNGA